MAKQNSAAQFETLKKDILAGRFSPVYILMGEEPFYPERLAELILEHALKPEERDFNQTILYGMDTTAEDIVSLCEGYPMMAERTLVIVREAQMLKKTDALATYLDHISETTVLVLLVSGKNLDKRTSFYKKAVKKAVVFESPKVAEEAMPAWIGEQVRLNGKKIDPQAALLMTESAGNDLRKVSVEIGKLIRAIPEDQETITPADIERNIGISREFNITELTAALSVKDAEKAFRIAWHFGESPKKYPIQMTVGFLFFFFSKVETIHAVMMKYRTGAKDAASKAGIYYSYAAPYLAAVNNYSLRKTMRIIAWLKETDYKSKSSLGSSAADGELLTELIGRILS